MNKALQAFLSKSHGDGVLAGVIGLGGSGGMSLLSSAFRSLPLGIPKLIMSTVASGQTEPYMGTSDFVLFPSVVDICGINSVSRVVLHNAAAAFSGMVIGNLDSKSSAATTATTKGTFGLTMFGVTTLCVNAVTDRLAREVYETLVFHATSVGGRSMEDLVRGGFIHGVLDITTSEVADYIVGGVMPCDASRFDAIVEKRIPLVLSTGALNMVNFGPKDTVPCKFQERMMHVHNDQPKMGASALDAPGKAFYDPDATGILLDELQRLIETNEFRQSGLISSPFTHEPSGGAQIKTSASAISSQNIVPISYSLSNFPDAKPEIPEQIKRILQKLKYHIQEGKPIIGAGAGIGISAKFEEVAGRGSVAGLLPFADANAIVLEMANEVLRVVKEVPILAGVCATDPFQRMDIFLKQLESIGNWNGI
ncbi:hypothetical protein OROMI_011683 [Orobanche minor]